MIDLATFIPEKSISPRIAFPANFNNRFIALERNTMTFSCDVYLNGKGINSRN